jgi:hypothetical protein
VWYELQILLAGLEPNAAETRRTIRVAAITSLIPGIIHYSVEIGDESDECYFKCRFANIKKISSSSQVEIYILVIVELAPRGHRGQPGAVISILEHVESTNLARE